MAESVVLLAIVVVMRLAAWQMAMITERARNRGLAAVLREVQPDAVVVSHRSDGETLIVCSRSAQATGAR